ncbi:hypothetical protein KP509_18G058400 [Ceratopteris richardii]|uniref:Uncharacterized protein n=1 Tax=Ceratopteris richardii TaxID=49495 RepID=A0A8T2SPU8_CERRI|nr:hypothetical protein KP509_18G058400 [Ceratopteris richardii]
MDVCPRPHLSHLLSCLAPAIIRRTPLLSTPIPELRPARFAISALSSSRSCCNSPGLRWLVAQCSIRLKLNCSYKSQPRDKVHICDDSSHDILRLRQPPVLA